MKNGEFTVEDLKAAYYADKIREYCFNNSNCETGCIFCLDTLKNGTFCQLKQDTPENWITTKKLNDPNA